MPVSCTAAWPLPRAISQRLTGKAKTPATTRANGEAAPEEHVVEAGLHRAGDGEMIALSTISIVAMLSVSEASAIGMTARQRQAGPQQRQAGERVAEEEGERHGERDRAEVGEPERGADDHADDLADRAAGQAMQRRAERDAGRARDPRSASRGDGPWAAASITLLRLTIPPRGYW